MQVLFLPCISLHCVIYKDKQFNVKRERFRIFLNQLVNLTLILLDGCPEYKPCYVAYWFFQYFGHHIQQEVKGLELDMLRGHLGSSYQGIIIVTVQLLNQFNCFEIWANMSKIINRFRRRPVEIHVFGFYCSFNIFIS